MRAGTVVRQPLVEAAPRVTLDDPAVTVMTDLTRVPAVLVDPDVDIEAAMRIMIRRNVRSLFVVNVNNEIVGLITATDLLGEKQHAMAVEDGPDGRQLVRGVFSASQLEKQLGQPVAAGSVSRTFAEIVAALAR